MTDRSYTPSRAPAKAGAIALLIAAIVGVLAPLTTARECTRHVAYQDFAKHVWTICSGHTGPDVHSGSVATGAQVLGLLAAGSDGERYGCARLFPGAGDACRPAQSCNRFRL